jgi:hypothetical protein
MKAAKQWAMQTDDKNASKAANERYGDYKVDDFRGESSVYISTIALPQSLRLQT